MDLFDFGAIATLLMALGGAWLVARFAARHGVDVTGIEALVLGIAAGPYGQEVVTEAALADLNPAASFALGALGLGVGLRLRIDDFTQRPAESLRITVILALTTLTVVGIAVYALLLLVVGGNNPDGVIAAAAAVLTAAALLAAPGAVERVAAHHNASGGVTDLLSHVARYSEVLGVVVFGLLLCVLHVGETSVAGGRPLVPMEWAVLAIVAGAVVGLLFAFFLGRADETSDALAVTILGMVLFASGIAYSLNLSPLMVCLVVGLVAANSSPAHAELREAMAAIERPLLAVVVFFAAVAWRVPPAAAWALVAAYIAARLAARWLGGHLAAYSCATATDRPITRVGLTLLGQGGLAVAIALNAWQVYNDALTSTVLTCLLVAALVNSLPSLRLIRNTLIDAGELPDAPQAGGLGGGEPPSLMETV